MRNKKKISNRGIAEQSGLDVLSGITTYEGEYLNFGNALAYVAQLTSDTDYATTAADPHLDALVNSPAANIGTWYRYHTSGGSWTVAIAPRSLDGYFIFNGQKTAGNASFSGMYQKLSIVKDNNYEIQIQTSISLPEGTLYGRVYTPVGSTYISYHETTVSYPVRNTSTGLQTSTFTAQSANDIFVLYFTTDATSSVTVSATNISIKEKKEFLVPLHVNTVNGVSHNVLKSSHESRAYNLQE